MFSNASAFAVGLDTEKIIGSEQATFSEAEVLAEDVSKRSEYEKHYLRSDGTYVAVSYNDAIHYKDDNGEWQDVDNKIELDTADGKYKNGTPSFRTDFRSASTGGSLVKISSKDSEISWNLSVDAPISTVKNAITSKNIEDIPISTVLKNAEADNTDKFALTRAKGGIEYRNVFGNAPEITVNYSVHHNRVEEDLYFNSQTNVTDIKMEMHLGDLSASVNSDGSVSIVDNDGNLKYRIGIPYMQDASDNVLYDIEVKASQNGEYCTITYTPNKAWLTSSERTYPILFDPSVTTSEYNSNVQDTYILQGSTESYSTLRWLYVGVGEDSLVRRTYIRFGRLPEIDPTMPIISAELTFVTYTANMTPRTAGLYKIMQSWDESAINYSNAPTGPQIATSDYISSSRKYSFDLTDYVHDMYEAEASNTEFSFMVRHINESTESPVCNDIYSSEYNNTTFQPALKVVYGYSMPQNIQLNKEYYIKSAHNTYLTVHDGTDANGVNIYAANLNATASQKFKLVQTSAKGGYYIQSVSSSNNRVVDVYREDRRDSIEGGSNVHLYNSTDPYAQEWFIIGVTSTSFRIVPRTDMSLALTANSGNGTSSGTTSASTGNVYVSTYIGSQYQLWQIIDPLTGNAVQNTVRSLADGRYYLNNRSSGKYLQRTGASTYLSGVSGLVSSLGDSIKWEVSHVGNDTYTIRAINDDYGYLYASGSSAFVGAMSGNNLTDAYLWKFINASGEGYAIKNVGTGKYLSDYGVLATTLPSQTSSSYGQYVWRSVLISTSINELQSVEMSLMLYKDGIEAVSIAPTPSNAKWTDVSDFTFSISDSSLLEYYGNGMFSGKGKADEVNVTATHKPTGKTTTFTAYIVEFDEGTYFLQNRETEKYAQHYSTQIKQAPFDGGDDQKWNLTFVGEGYYAIINDDNNYAVTVPSGSGTSNNTNLTLTTYSATNNNQKWSITLTDNGSYKIKAKCAANTTNPELVFAVQTGSGDNIQQNDYDGENDSYKDEWFIVKKVLTIVHYYDWTFIDDPRAEYIDEAQHFLNFVYSKYFNLGMYSSLIYDERSLTTNCPNGYYSPCNDTTCGDNCNLHHKSTKRISDQLYYAPREDDHIYVLWTNYDENIYCTEESGVHKEEDALAVVQELYRPIIHFLRVLGDSDDASLNMSNQERLNLMVSCMARVLAHETAHVLGMDEVYYDTEHLSNNPNCIMGPFYVDTAYTKYQSILNDNVAPFCDSCSELLKEFAENIQILGNGG